MPAKPTFRMRPYRMLPGVDWMLLGVTLALLLCGIITLWGATRNVEQAGLWPPPGFALKQMQWAALGCCGMVALAFVDYRKLRVAAWVAYGLLALVLIAVLLFGQKVNGARSWFNFGPLKLQPSEPSKLIVIFVLADYLSRRALKFRGLRHTIVPGLIVLLPMGLILLQPDFGTAATFIPITAAMFWVAGLRKRIFLLFICLGVAGAISGYTHLKPYQKDRLLAFANPEADSRGRGYNVIQAKTALGSGQMLGKGWGEGTQTRFKFLPEFHTDFIFPTVGEQFGLVGCVTVLGLLLFFIWRLARLAQATQDLMGVLILTGILAMICTHITLNVGMTIGLLPVTGLPLPFFSYGGSFMLLCLTAVGLALGIGARRGL